MSNFFIQYRPYKGLNNIECQLMSWIVGLHKQNKTICFTNRYASFVFRVSESTITRGLKGLLDKGYVESYQPYGDKRFIRVLEIPPVEEFNDEVCDLEVSDDRVVNMTTGGSQFDEGYSQSDEGGVVNLTTNIIVDKIEDIIVSANTQNPSQQEEDDLELFTFMFVEFNEPDKEFDVLYDYWKNKLTPQEQMNAVKYSSNFRKYCEKKKWSKSMYWYFKEKKFNWSSIRN